MNFAVYRCNCAFVPLSLLSELFGFVGSFQGIPRAREDFNVRLEREKREERKGKERKRSVCVLHQDSITCKKAASLSLLFLSLSRSMFAQNRTTNEGRDTCMNTHRPCETHIEARSVRKKKEFLCTPFSCSSLCNQSYLFSSREQYM